MVADGLIESDPLAELPYLPEPQVSPTLPVAEVDDIADLVATCASNSFEDVRDRALIHVLADTGVRRDELVGMRWSDLDLAGATITLRSETTKVSKSRVVAIGSDTIRALRLYLRRLDLLSHDDPMWIGRRGPLASNGVGQLITKRARRADVNLTAHSFRRGLATRWLRQGGSEVHLMRLAGWTSPRMIARYVASVATEESLRTARTFLDAEHGPRRLRAV
jgi:integrase